MTNAILQPEPRDGLETGLHVFPNLGANLVNISSPNAGGIVGLPVIANFANPMQFICSSIQAGSRLGYQESAELCAQYLAPILDAIKFNYLPFGIEPDQRRDDAAQADRLLRARGCSRRRATRTPPCRASSRATPCSRTATTSRAGSSRPACRASTCSRSPSEHADAGVARRADGWPRHRGPAGAARVRRHTHGRPAGPPNAYSENTPAAAAVVPAAGPPPAPAPGVIPGDPLGADHAGGTAPGPAPAPAGPPLPAELEGANDRGQVGAASHAAPSHCWRSRWC